MQQPDGSPQTNCKEGRKLSSEAAKNYFFASLATRWASLETFRRAALRCTMPFCAARISAGSASAMAASARELSPAVNASSTLRMAERTCARRDLLTTVRRAIWRVAFLADLVLAMDLRTYTIMGESGAYRG